MVLGKVESLSGRTGLGRRETIVSAVIAEALKDPENGGGLLAALLGRPQDRLNVLTARSEVSVQKQRFDVVVLFREGGKVRPLVIEVKVSAQEGNQQLERYLVVVRGEKFQGTIRDLLNEGGHAEHESIADTEILYLTVAPEPHEREGITYRTFQEWNDDLGTQRRADATIEDGALAVDLLRDTLQYLGQELAPEAALVRSIGTDTRISKFRGESVRGFALGKQLSAAVADVFRKQFDVYNSGGDTREFGRYWLYRGNGSLEFAYYRLSWQMQWQVKGREDPLGILVSEIWSVDLASLGDNNPKIDLRFRLQIDPHTTKKALPNLLTPEQIDAFYDLRDTFRDELLDLASGGPVEGYETCRNYLQVGKVPVALDREETLGEAAKKLWEASVLMAPLIDEALDRLVAFGYDLDVLEDDGEMREGERLPCFRTELDG